MLDIRDIILTKHIFQLDFQILGKNVLGPKFT